MTLTLIVGSKNYSSWSMRAGVALAHCGVAYSEIVVPLGQPDTAQRIAAYSKAGLVPVLIDGDVTVWDSLSIVEYLSERFPAAQLWPADPALRAVARSVSAEMHAGFTALRRELPMNCRRRYQNFAIGEAASKDIDRICDIWRDIRNLYGRTGGGDFLFGSFSGADAMFAPVVSRFVTYGVAVDTTVGAYIEAVVNAPPVKTWMESARQEPVIDRYEFA